MYKEELCSPCCAKQAWPNAECYGCLAKQESEECKEDSPNEDGYF